MRRSRPQLWVALVVLLVAVAQGCAGGASPGRTPAASPTVEASLTPHPTASAIAPTLEPLPPITLSERVTFYGRDAGDAATGLATGDFNGDDVPDVALAAAFADGPDNARPDAGEAYIFFGPFTPGETRDAGLGQQDVTVYGAAAGDQMGRAAAAADVNSDALDDLILGAPFADGPSDQRPDAGDTLIIAGRRSWPVTIDLAKDAPSAVAFGADPKDLSGFSLATADANGDHVRDILIGAFWADGPDNKRVDAGEAYLVFGSPTLPPSIDLAEAGQDVTFYGAEADDRLAETVAAGDVTGDGVDDLVLAATFAGGPDNQRPKAGEVFVISGGHLRDAYDFASDRPTTTILGPDEGDQIGHSVAVADFSGDGIGDLLLGAVSADGPANDRDLAGEAYLVVSSASNPDIIDTLMGGAALRLYGAAAGDRLGRSAAAGDLNGDGLGDLLLAASGSDGLDGSLKDAGEVYVIYGRPVLRGSLDLARQATDMVIPGLDPGDTLGLNAFGRPSLLSRDVDGDGLDDVLVSALGDGPGNDRADAGEAYIIFPRR